MPWQDKKPKYVATFDKVKGLTRSIAKSNFGIFFNWEKLVHFKSLSNPAKVVKARP